MMYITRRLRAGNSVVPSLTEFSRPLSRRCAVNGFYRKKLDVLIKAAQVYKTLRIPYSLVKSDPQGIRAMRKREADQKKELQKYVAPGLVDYGNVTKITAANKSISGPDSTLHKKGTCL
jgi:hypothetical protein